jgi:murein L,D-transpeptidase YcbB/YkuD
VTSLRKARTGHRPVRPLFLIAGAVAILAAAPVSFPAPAEAKAESAARGQGVGDFYDARQDRLLWFQAGQPNIAAHQLVSLIATADHDGLDPGRYKAKALAKAIREAAEGDDGDVGKADRMLSKAFVDYARDLQDAPAAGMQFVDPRLRPEPPSPRSLLAMAAAAPSLAEFVKSMGWMNPNYAPLRRALMAGTYSTERQRDLIQVNLERARELPASSPRYVIVNAAAQRLEMYEGNRLVDSMRVVVGKQRDNNRTPMMASFLSQASLNPYWNVPNDLAAERIAPNVVKLGLGYLHAKGYQVLSDWGENARVVDPASVDWQAVADGRIEVRVRQLPGPENALGKVKFTMLNPYGVYLHDTPDKALLNEETRLFSGGCIRLEDAPRFGRWLYGRTLTATSDAPDIPVPLDRPVPIFVTYLTVVPSGSSIAFLNDVYGWDAERLAETGPAGAVAAR